MHANSVRYAMASCTKCVTGVSTSRAVPRPRGRCPSNAAFKVMIAATEEPMPTGDANSLGKKRRKKERKKEREEEKEEEEEEKKKKKKLYKIRGRKEEEENI